MALNKIGAFFGIITVKDSPLPCNAVLVSKSLSEFYSHITVGFHSLPNTYWYILVHLQSFSSQAVCKGVYFAQIYNDHFNSNCSLVLLSKSQISERTSISQCNQNKTRPLYDPISGHSICNLHPKENLKSIQMFMLLFEKMQEGITLQQKNICKRQVSSLWQSVTWPISHLFSTPLD